MTRHSVITVIKHGRPHIEAWESSYYYWLLLLLSYNVVIRQSSAKHLKSGTALSD